MFKVRVDTGGTFTDCWGKPDGDAAPRLVKVLSSGRLRIAVKQWFSPQELQIQLPENWVTSDGFFNDYQVETDKESTIVISYDDKTHRLLLADSVSKTKSIDLHANEEAPVLGARLLTGTSLECPFPELDFRLATTRGTNALLERKGGKVALFVTEGFADLLTIRDQRRPDLFALQHARPSPLFEQVIEVPGRLDAEGREITPIDFSQAFEAALEKARQSGITLGAVALLHSYRNKAHENAVAKRLIEAGFEILSCSSELAPLIKILPRAETAVVNSYLHPVMQSFLDHIRYRIGDDRKLLTMTSAGGLEPIGSYCPKDSLLSGPAGGVSGAAAIAGELECERILTFDMGGTSTDVARYERGFQYRFEQIVGDARLLSPALKIETVAAGGGSICAWEQDRLKVGPESAGADPGPACYGRGGPLTVTDVNLLLGRIDPDNFGIPLSEENLSASKKAAMALQHEAGLPEANLSEEFLRGLLDIAVEQMADAIRTISIRDGADPSDYALLAFGGAGPLHACDIAERLNVRRILIPAEAGLLSAYGLDQASIERFAEQQVNLTVTSEKLPDIFNSTDDEALSALERAGFSGEVNRRIVELRLAGQDATLTVEVSAPEALESEFGRVYQNTFGYDAPSDRPIEVVSYRAIAGTGRSNSRKIEPTHLRRKSSPSAPLGHGTFVDRSGLQTGSTVHGPSVIQDPFSTLFLKSGWTAQVAFNGSLDLHYRSTDPKKQSQRPAEIVHELFRHRFDNLVEEMGTILQRAAVSTNVKERADFSCALLDSEGQLISSAPHIPVHLGALGMCVRKVRKVIKMRPGDTIVTNHPAIGGSHLPDVTLVTPVFAGQNEALIGYVANRAHHAEIGGIAPGSMPPSATCLAEEGVLISPTHLIDEGSSCFDKVSEILTKAPYPTRHLKDNLADLNAQLASNRRGETLLQQIADGCGIDLLKSEMLHLKQQSFDALGEHLSKTGFEKCSAIETLDDGTPIEVRILNDKGKLTVDLSGTGATLPGNLNATPAIVQSAVLYALRLWMQSKVPLNEGMLRSAEIILPECFLNPTFFDDPTKSPAVVGGNVESSQRLVDTLIKALEIQACSQGTMNNFLFGDENFGYYETICGGSGAGEGYNGTAGIHTHMTNTAITDPEILEQRYPVRLHRFSIRNGSGGDGKWSGGDGIIREVEFLKPLQVSLIAQHRQITPFGGNGGSHGRCGQQFLNDKPINGTAAFAAAPGDRLRIETPGGGGWGSLEG